MFELGSENEFDGVGCCVLSVVECFGGRCGKVRALYDVVAHSAFGEDMLRRYSDAPWDAYGNVCFGHKKTTIELSIPYAE